MTETSSTGLTLALSTAQDPWHRTTVRESAVDVWDLDDPGDPTDPDPMVPVVLFGPHAPPAVLRVEVGAGGGGARPDDRAEVRIRVAVGRGGLDRCHVRAPDGWQATTVDDGVAPYVAVTRSGRGPVTWPVPIEVETVPVGCLEGDRGFVEVDLVGFRAPDRPDAEGFTGVPLFVVLREAASPNAPRPALPLTPRWVADHDVVVASVSLDDEHLIANRLAFTLQCPRAEGQGSAEGPYLPTITVALPSTDGDTSLVVDTLCTAQALEVSPPQLLVTSSTGERWVATRIGRAEEGSVAWSAQPRHPLRLESGTTLTFVLSDLVCHPMPGDAEAFVSSPLFVEWASPQHSRTATSLMVTALPPITLDNFEVAISDVPEPGNRRAVGAPSDGPSPWRRVDLGWDVEGAHLVDRYELTSRALHAPGDAGHVRVFPVRARPDRREPSTTRFMAQLELQGLIAPGELVLTAIPRAGRVASAQPNPTTEPWPLAPERPRAVDDGWHPPDDRPRRRVVLTDRRMDEAPTE